MESVAIFKKFEKLFRVVRSWKRKRPSSFSDQILRSSGKTFRNDGWNVFFLPWEGNHNGEKQRGTIFRIFVSRGWCLARVKSKIRDENYGWTNERERKRERERGRGMNYFYENLILGGGHGARNGIKSWAPRVRRGAVNFCFNIDTEAERLPRERWSRSFTMVILLWQYCRRNISSPAIYCRARGKGNIKEKEVPWEPAPPPFEITQRGIVLSALRFPPTFELSELSLHDSTLTGIVGFIIKSKNIHDRVNIFLTNGFKLGTISPFLLV